MADYTEEQRVKQVWSKAWCCFCRLCPLCHIYSGSPQDAGFRKLGEGETESDAWADASRRLGNEFVDEVGPLAERKEG